jgi:eukaryotic-like serine/threonine-protein kinase
MHSRAGKERGVSEVPAPSASSAGGSGPIRYGRYVLIDRLGAGGMAEVFRALVLGPEQFQRMIVVKRILPQLSANPAFVRMFIDEATLCGRLSHPNIIQVHEFGRCDDRYFIAMEYVHGRSVSHLISGLIEQRKIVPVNIAVEIMRQVCRGLAYAHGLTAADGKPLGIIHRDVSPGNVIVAFNGAVKLLDFGVARVENRFRVGSTDPGHVKGKTSYLAPEQITNDEVDHRADIFSAGILLYEMLTTRRLFKSDSASESMEMVRSMPIPAPSWRNRRIPPRLDAIVMCALERERSARYQDAGLMANDLEQFLLEQQFSSQELANFMRESFEEESTIQQVQLSPAEIESLGGFELPEASGGQTVTSELKSGLSALSQVSGRHRLNRDPRAGAPRPTGSRRKGGLLVTGALLAAAAAGLYALTSRQPGPGASGAGAATEVLPPETSVPPAEAPAPSPPHDPAETLAEVTISISSEPTGATVYQGSDVRPIGVTPLEVNVSRGDDPVVFRIRKTGFVEGVLKLVPDADRPALVTLAKAIPVRRTGKVEKTEKVRNAVPIDPFAP